MRSLIALSQDFANEVMTEYDAGRIHKAQAISMIVVGVLVLVASLSMVRAVQTLKEFLFEEPLR